MWSTETVSWRGAKRDRIGGERELRGGCLDYISDIQHIDPTLLGTYPVSVWAHLMTHQGHPTVLRRPAQQDPFSSPELDACNILTRSRICHLTIPQTRDPFI